MHVKYPINLTSSLNNDLKITTRDIHIVAYDKTWHSTIHQHPFTEIFYCLSGTGNIWIDGQEYPIKKSSLVIINPHTPHTEFSNPQRPLKYIVIGIHGMSLLTNDQQSSYFIAEDTFNRYANYFDDILDELDHPSAYTNEIVHYLVNIILLKLQNRIKSLTITENNNELSTAVYNTKLYIDNNLSSNITLDALETITHTSKYHLSRLFKEEMEMTIIDYMTKARLTRAEELLTSTNYTINQIAAMTGFSTASYFSSKFKTLYGFSPSEFRKKKAEIS